MTFTNTDFVGNYIVFWQDDEMVYDELVRVCDQVSWKVYVQIKLIKTKIKQELNK